MDIRRIRTDADLTEALQEIDRLWGAPVGTPEGDKFDVLATLAEAYERAQHPVPESDDEIGPHAGRASRLAFARLRDPEPQAPAQSGADPADRAGVAVAARCPGETLSL